MNMARTRKTKLLELRVPTATADRLVRLAKSFNRTQSDVAVEAIEEFLSRQEWQTKAVEHAIAQADAGELVDHADVKSRFSTRW